MNYENLSINNLHERELHPFLVRYLAKKMNVYSKTIYHEVSTKTAKGKSEWLHPDIVGFNLPVENWSEKVLELCGNFSISRATIYSFELKKVITIDSLREQFFQAVSNSSWANEGYLVGVDIDVENLELMQEMNRLSSAFGIGIIKLNLANCEASEILFQSRRKGVLDGETMNKLFNINNNFQAFIQVVLDSIKINSTIANKLDAVLSPSQLKEILERANTLSQIENTKQKDTRQESKADIVPNEHYLSLTDDFTGFSPVSIEFDTTIVDVESWKDLYISVCNYLIEKDNALFVTISSKIKGKKRPYFTKNQEEIRVGYHLDKVNLYAEINLSANSIGNIVKRLFEEYGIDTDTVKVRVSL